MQSLYLSLFHASIMRKIFFTSIILLFSIALQAQEIRVRKGASTDSLPIPGVPSATYAMYMPSNYSPDKEWPIVFVFDSQGRGVATANLFRAAAEEQDYIVASINLDLKSKPIDTIISTATTMINGVMGTFPVDVQQVYTAGLGEGAQVGSAMPIIFKDIAGILAVGNSFVNPDRIKKQDPNMFIGIAGSKDYMVYEMEQYLKYYDKLDFPTDVYYFEGKEDEWPESTVIANAMAGFTLQAIKDGSRPKDDTFIKKLFDNEMAYVESLRRTRNYYSAYQNLERMEDKYEDLGFEDAIKDQMKTIKRIDGFNRQRRQFREATAVEREQQAEYEYLLVNDVMTANFQNIGWWAYQIDELEKIKESENPARSNMAYRLHGYLDFLTKKQFDMINKDNFGIDSKIFISVLRTAIRRNDPEAYFKVISLASLDGDYETALLYLEDLLKTGYKDYEKLYDIEGALDLQFSEEYNAIVQKYLGKSKYHVDAKAKLQQK